MSTEIKTIKGTCHYHPEKETFKIQHKEAEVNITRFWNGEKKGRCIQLTVSQDGEYGTSYIHLTENQCKKLAKVLLECFDDKKYPSQ